MSSVAFDPGTVKMGVSVYTPAEGELVMRQLNLLLDRSQGEGEPPVQLEYREKDIPRNLEWVCDLHDAALKKATCIGVEKQLQAGIHTGGPRKERYSVGLKRDMVVLSEKLVSYLKGRYPQAEVFMVDPWLVREWFDTHGDCYDGRKANSMDLLPRVIGPMEGLKYAQVFTRNAVDPIESALLAIYILHNIEKLRALAKERPAQDHVKEISNPKQVRTLRTRVTPEFRSWCMSRKLDESKPKPKKPRKPKSGEAKEKKPRKPRAPKDPAKVKKRKPRTQEGAKKKRKVVAE